MYPQQYTPTLWWQKVVFQPGCIHCGKSAQLQALWCFTCKAELLQLRRVNARYCLQYEGSAKCLVARIREQKCCKSVALAARFIQENLTHLRWNPDFTICVPSSKREASGIEMVAQKFAQSNQCTQLFRFLYKQREHVQHKRGIRARLDCPNFIGYRKEQASLLQNKKILLLDDVYTTGTSLLQAEIQLKKLGAEVLSFTLARAQFLQGQDRNAHKKSYEV